MPVVGNIEQEPREIHAGKLRRHLIFGERGQQRIVEIPAQNVRCSVSIPIDNGLSRLRRLGTKQVHHQHRRARFHERAQLVPKLEWIGQETV